MTTVTGLFNSISKEEAILELTKHNEGIGEI